MNSGRSVTCMLPVVALPLAFALAIGAQGPLLPTLARLDALKLASIEGDVPVRYSKATDVLLMDFAGIAPGWDEWLVEQGATATLARATLSLPDTLSFVH
jgi:hypothetical protein